VHLCGGAGHRYVRVLVCRRGGGGRAHAECCGRRRMRLLAAQHTQPLRTAGGRIKTTASSAAAAAAAGPPAKPSDPAPRPPLPRRGASVQRPPAGPASQARPSSGLWPLRTSPACSTSVCTRNLSLQCAMSGGYSFWAYWDKHTYAWFQRTSGHSGTRAVTLLRTTARTAAVQANGTT
jgi:hypothetical protein